MAESDVVLIPRDVVERAVCKARVEYRKRDGLKGLPAEDAPCWSEFNNLASYLRPEAAEWMAERGGSFVPVRLLGARPRPTRGQSR